MSRIALLALVGCGTSAATAPDAATPDAAPPAWSSDLDATDGFDVRGDVATPGGIARLTLHGDPALGPSDDVGPAYASELATQRSFGHGVYRMRVSLAACATSEEVVNGLFTYFNDGGDHDGDGLVDNDEIDIEILCGTPTVVFLTAWTEYTASPETFRKWTRAIDLATGDLWDAPSDHEYGLVAAGNDPSLALPDLLTGFVELGFEWRADRLTWFAGDHTLAELTDPTHIPTTPGQLMLNVWHPADHWFGGGAAPDYPATDAVLQVDWARYWE